MMEVDPCKFCTIAPYLCCVQVLIKFKNFFYFEEKDEPVEDFDKVYKFLEDSSINSQ